jgi:large subunit ribosomal protein L22
MQIRAEQKNSRQSPRKVRLVANQIKDLPLEQAFVQLSLMERKASLVLLKVLRQAVANALNNHQLNMQDLAIKSIVVKTGPTYKRMRAVSRGRGHRILKRTCHVEVILTTKSDSATKKQVAEIAKKTKVEKVEKKQDTKVAKKAEKKEVKKDIAKVKKFEKKTKAPAKIKDETKISNQKGIQQPVTKIHRRKSGV